MTPIVINLVSTSTVNCCYYLFLQNDQFQPPIPLQPPPPESPIETNCLVKTEDINPSDEEEFGASMPDSSAEILMYEEQEFYVKDVASSDAALLMKDDNIVKAISTPSPEQMSPVSKPA